MNILILGFTKIKYMPYLNFYLDNIDLKQNNVHLVYWNRDCNDDIHATSNIILHEFKCYQKDEVSKVKKVKSFIKYRNFTLKLLKSENFDFVVVLHTLPGALISNFLLKHYSNKFILDYRDYTYEKINFFRNIICGLVKHSKYTFVSSDAFRKNLPKSDKIHTSHNILLDSLNHRETNTKILQPISMAFWGFIRHETINKEIIKKLKNDSRFELHYYGREQETALNLKKFAEENNAKNIFFHGEYKPIERYEFAQKTSIIHNLYDNDVTSMAMGNKYYDGIAFYLPQLCNAGSFMGEMVEKAGIGIACNPYSDTFADDVYNYYINLDLDKFKKNCDKELDRIMREYNEGTKIVKNI